MNPTPFDCEQTFVRLQDYLDRELSPEEIRLVEQHLDVCAICAEEYAFEASLLRNLRARILHIDIPNDLRQRVGQALDQLAS